MVWYGLVWKELRTTFTPTPWPRQKTFDMNAEAVMFPDEFYSFVKELQEQLAEGKIDRILIQRWP